MRPRDALGLRSIAPATRVAVLVAALAMSLTACQATTEPPRDLPRADSVSRSLGRGLNLGNILEAPHEGDWGLSLTDDLFEVAVASGARTVRLPVRWSNHALADPPYTVDAAFFTRVDHAIDAATARGLRIVVNMHHYRQLDGDPLDDGEAAVDPSRLEARFVAIWAQVAARYRTRPRTVLFELYNEPHGAQTAGQWNSLLLRALAVVRAEDPDRYVVIGPAQWNSAWALDALQLPAADWRIIVTVHDYEPFAFTHQGAAWAGLEGSPAVECCTVEQQAQMVAPLDRARDWAEAQHRPIWVGEFGAYGAGPYASRVTWTRTIRDAMEGRGFGWAYWELASGFGFYDHASGAVRTELRDALFQ